MVVVLLLLLLLLVVVVLLGLVRSECCSWFLCFDCLRHAFSGDTTTSCTLNLSPICSERLACHFAELSQSALV